MLIKECDWQKREESEKRKTIATVSNDENDKKRAAHIFIYIHIYIYMYVYDIYVQDNEESLGRFGFRST